MTPLKVFIAGWLTVIPFLLPGAWKEAADPEMRPRWLFALLIAAFGAFGFTVFGCGLVGLWHWALS